MRSCKSEQRSANKTSATYAKCTTPCAAPDDTKLLTLIETEANKRIEVLVRDSQKLHRSLLLDCVLMFCRVQLPQQIVGEDERAHILYLRAETDHLAVEYACGGTVEPLLIDRS